MIDWLIENKAWFFSGAGVAIIGAIWYGVRWLWSAKRGKKAAVEAMNRLQAENASLRKQVAELEALVASTDKGGQQGAEASFTDDAKTLLLAAKNGDGYIVYHRYMTGAAVQAGNRNFINPENSAREESRWKAALNELLARRLAEAVGNKGTSFRLTKRGYEVADEIEPTTAKTQAEPSAPPALGGSVAGDQGKQ